MKKGASAKPFTKVDRGWAWLVCLGASLCNVASLGYFTTLGIFYIEWKEYFDLSATASSWLVGMPLLVASPLSLFSGEIAAHVGVRRLAMVGSTVNGLATILGSFVGNVWQLYLCGAMAGMGLALMVPPAVIVLSQYFKERFALANGLFILGSSIAQMIFPPILRLLISNYGWRGSMLVVGALQLNAVAGCALFRPFKTNLSEVRKPREVDGWEYEGASVVMETDVLDEQHDVELGSHMPDQTCTASNLSSNDSQISHGQVETNQNREATETASRGTQFSIDEWDDNEPQVASNAKRELVLPEEHQDNVKLAAIKDLIIPEENPKNTVRHRRLFNFMIILKNPLVLLSVSITCLYAMAFTANVTHLPARANEAGLSDEKSALLLTVFAILSMITRATHGWFVDRHYIGSFNLQMTAMLGAGIATFLNQLSDNYVFLVGYSGVVGAMVGIGSPLILVNSKCVVKTAQVPAMFGLILAAVFLFNGTGSVIAGKIYDVTGNYVASFYVAGAMFMTASIFTALVAVLHRRKAKGAKDQMKTTTVTDRNVELLLFRSFSDPTHTKGQ